MTPPSVSRPPEDGPEKVRQLVTHPVAATPASPTDITCMHGEIDALLMLKRTFRIICNTQILNLDLKKTPSILPFMFNFMFYDIRPKSLQ